MSEEKKLHQIQIQFYKIWLFDIEFYVPPILDKNYLEYKYLGQITI